MDIHLEEFESRIRKMFAEGFKKEVCYHNLDHTLLIVEKVGEIGNHYRLEKEDLEDLYFAAWLHDVGYWEGTSNGHEERSAGFAQAHLNEMGLDAERVDRVKSIIMATKVRQKPKNLVESILCDADLYHLSSKEFYDQTMLLKKEKENFGIKHLKELDWLRESKTFMEEHEYHTDYAKEYFQPGKQDNLRTLRELIWELETEMDGKVRDRRMD